MKTKRVNIFAKIQGIYLEFFGLGRGVLWGTVALVVLFLIFAVFWFIHAAVPRTVIMTTGPEGSVFQSNGDKYAKILARSGIRLKVLRSEGSLENIKRLTDSKFRVDVGLVQGGLAGGLRIEKVVSLGAISYAPLLVFCRGNSNAELLSQLKGKRLAIGPVGSGTRSLASTLLAANGIEPGDGTQFLDLDSDAAATDLLAGKVDAVFMMGDAASTSTIQTLLRTPGIQLLDFSQADAYIRRIGYLNKLNLPRGSVDFGKNIPPHDISLIGPTVELVARENLHPALSDILIEAAREVHGGASLFKQQGEFPKPLEREYHVSDDANRYYKSGKSFFYRFFPFWLASLVSRFLVVLVPFFVIILPVLRIIPIIFQWRVKMDIYRWYRALLKLEQELFGLTDRDKKEALIRRIDKIESDVNKMKVPASCADQYYELRGHIRFVRNQVTAMDPVG